MDISPENIFSPDGTIAQDEVQQHCRHYEQLIRDKGGMDIMLLGVGRMGNIATKRAGKRAHVHIAHNTYRLDVA